MEAGQDWETGVEVLVGAEVETGQPSVSIEYASQARLRLENYAAHTHTEGATPFPPRSHSHTHTHKETGQLNLVGLPSPQTDPVERAQRFKFSSLNNILFWRPTGLTRGWPEGGRRGTQLCPVDAYQNVAAALSNGLAWSSFWSWSRSGLLCAAAIGG